VVREAGATSYSMITEKTAAERLLGRVQPTVLLSAVLAMHCGIFSFTGTALAVPVVKISPNFVILEKVK
jgi:hypothetical protein